MTMTVVAAQAHLDAWLAADLAASRNKSYAIGDRTLTRADLSEIREAIGYWSRVVNNLTAAATGASNIGIKVATWS